MNIGKNNRLRVKQQTAAGLELDSGTGAVLLLPNDEIPAGFSFNPWTGSSTEPGTGQWLDVFVYTNAAGLPLATTVTPLVQVGQCALLHVVAKSPAGTWLDWGLTQDLLLPRSEQNRTPINVSHAEADSTVHAGDSVFVHVFLDASNNRVCATSRLHRHLQEDGSELTLWQKVQLTIAGRTELGFKAVIDQHYLGLLYAEEVFQPLCPGDQLSGYIKGVREDGKIDLTLHARAATLKDELGQRIVDHLKSSGGESSLTDKSPPEAIYRQFQVSKKSYKKALGNLYKARQIHIEDHRITLLEP